MVQIKRSSKAREEPEDIQVTRDGSTLPECNDGDDDVFEVLDVEDRDWSSDLEGGSDEVWDYDFEGSLADSELEEGKDILEDANGLFKLPPQADGNTRDDVDILQDADIQAFFDTVLQAFHALLNEISSTLANFGSLLDIIQAP